MTFHAIEVCYIAMKKVSLAFFQSHIKNYIQLENISFPNVQRKNKEFRIRHRRALRHWSRQRLLQQNTENISQV